MKEISPFNIQLQCNEFHGSFMFRLRKVAIIRLCMSDMYIGELCICSFTYGYKSLMDRVSVLHKGT